MIIDCHCHVAYEYYFPSSFLEGMMDNYLLLLHDQGIPLTRDKVRNYLLKKMQDKDCIELKKQMDLAEINQAVLLIVDFTIALKDCSLTIEEIFDGHHQILKKHKDQFYVFAGIDPRHGNDGFSLFEKAVYKMGFSGLKLYPPCGYKPDDRRLYPFYEICKKEKLPVLIHTGPTSPVLPFHYAHPSFIDQAALDFPEVNFILAHAGIKNYQEAALMAEFRPNVYLDISGFQSEMSPSVSQIQNKIKWLFHNRINHKILFGTDWPIFNPMGSQKKWVSFFQSLSEEILTSEDKNRLMYSNMKNLLPPSRV